MHEAILNLEKLIIQTPLIPFYNEGFDIQSRIFLKPENLQIFGSYKIRGVASVLKEIEPQILQKGLCAASAGNMAQAVAFAAQQLKIPCRIYVPESAPQTKLLAIQKLGAETIRLHYSDVWKIVRGDIVLPDDRFFIHPALNQFLLKGYAKIGDEIIEDMPDVDAVVIPFGVGGLSLGISNSIQNRNLDIAIYTCEPETASPFKKSLQLAKPSAINRISSFVDAIGTPEVLPQIFHQLAPLVKDSLVISIEEIKQALKSLYFNHKLVCEGAAGCSLAASIHLARLRRYRKIVCILSGGNIDTNVLNQFLL
jgi:threonine dehydratase